MADSSAPMRRIATSLSVLLVLACGVAFFWRLGDLGLLGPDEPRYARVAREMWTQGEWITPTLGKTPWFEKPALLYWLIGLGYHLIGVNEWAVRLPSAVAATLTVLALSALRPAHLGWSAALIATTSPLMLAFARAATFEALLTFAVTISLLMFHLSFEAVQSGWRMTVDFARVLFYVFLGIGLLAKGLVGLVLPVGSILLYALVVPDVRRQPAFFLRTLRPLTGLFITAAVAGIWYIPVMAQHGWAFVEEFFIAHHFQRFTSNRFRHPGPAYYYAPIVLLGVLPWTPFLLAGLYRSLRRLWRPNKLENALSEAPQSLIWLALCAFTFPILFFSFSGSKLPGYVLPAIPFAAILAAYGFWSLSARMRTLWLGVAGLGQVGLYIGLQIFIDKSLMEKTLSFIELFAGGLLVAGLGVSAVYAAQPSDALLRLSGGTLLLVLWLTTSFPALEAKFSTKGLSAAIDRAAQPGEIVAFFGCREYAPVFYNPAYTTCCDATREPYHLPNQAAVAAAVAERRTLLVVVPKARLAMLQSSAYTLTLLGEAGRFTLARLTATGPPSPKA